MEISHIEAKEVKKYLELEIDTPGSSIRTVALDTEQAIKLHDVLEDFLSSK